MKLSRRSRRIQALQQREEANPPPTTVSLLLLNVLTETFWRQDESPKKLEKPLVDREKLLPTCGGGF
jgi:hypothetical protein